jgi:hypothetical protein
MLAVASLNGKANTTSKNTARSMCGTLNIKKVPED